MPARIGTFGFARHTSRPFAKPKEPILATHIMSIRIENVTLQ